MNLGTSLIVTASLIVAYFKAAHNTSSELMQPKSSPSSNVGKDLVKIRDHYKYDVDGVKNIPPPPQRTPDDVAGAKPKKEPIFKLGPIGLNSHLDGHTLLTPRKK